MSVEVIKTKKGKKPEGWKNDCPKFKEYYAKQNPSWSEEECIDAAKKFCKSINWQCVEYYQKKFPNKTLEECEEMRSHAIEERKSNSKLNIEYYIKRYPDKTLEECEEMQRQHNNKNCPQRIEFYQKRYPDKTLEECEEMLKNTKAGVIEKHRSYKGENNPNHRSKTSDFERRSRSPKCIEFYQVRYPDATNDEQLEMLNSHLNKVNNIMQDKTKQVKCIEYWLAKGYSENEAKELISKSQKTFSLEKCIEKHGLEKGTQIFNNRQEKWLKSLQINFEKYGDGISASSEFAYDIIGQICNRLCIQRPRKEKFMTDLDGHHYSYDFCYNKKIIEFNGDYWHMNPNIFTSEDVNKTTKQTAAEIWEKDNKKKLCAEKNGYKVLYIWENEYIKSPDAVIKKCMKFLTS